MTFWINIFSSYILLLNFLSRPGLTIKVHLEKNELGPTLQEHFQGQILAVLTAGVSGERTNLVHPQAGIESLP